MKILTSQNEITTQIDTLKSLGKIVGFVPTMGALHDGHLSLVEIAGSQSDIVVVSIFVNPTQFNSPIDLERYPRNLEQDAAFLKKSKCDFIFAPSVKEIYPKPDNRIFDFGQLDKIMEGKFRPGHFNGVAQVVSRLFDIIKPHKAFFGEKDFQQLVIIRELVIKFNYNIEIVACPIKREKDGLAMSSRNILLTENIRKKVPIIADILKKSTTFAKLNSPINTKNFVVESIEKVEYLRVEYFEIVNGNSLQTIEKWDETTFVVGCIAVWAGDVRIIDNVFYKNNIT
ncbi:MAG: pantoate--beta-alanine ligase [Marinilabiliaceae bacterium]|nr:pantoate--beta-alanine ligase [Marinilabiliaceae bacterium]